MATVTFDHVTKCFGKSTCLRMIAGLEDISSSRSSTRRTASWSLATGERVKFTGEVPMMIDILTAIQAAAVIQAPSPVITDIREDAVLEVAPPDQTITMSPRPASDGATSR